MRKLSEAEIAYVAGVFEGEGCITIDKRAGRISCSVRLRVEMTDLDVIQKLQRLTGVGTLTQREGRQKGWKQQWCWSVHKQNDAKELLVAMIPWLSTRRTLKAVEALGTLEVDNSGNRHRPRDPRTGNFVRSEASMDRGQSQDYAASPFGSDSVNPY